MRHTALIVATLAVLLTLAAPALAGMETVRVLVAKQALSYGATLQPGNLQWVEWPKAAVPPGAFTSVEELLGEKGDQKRFVLRSIESGEPVVESKITKFGASPLMLMNLGAGMRAVSISINAVSGFAVGDSVDILLTRTQEGQLVSSVILPDITVISVDHRTNSEAASPQLGHTVIVEVDTVQAQKIALAQQVGRLSLTLRGIGEASDDEPGDGGAAFSQAGLENCAAIDNELDRLACYDKASGRTPEVSETAAPKGDWKVRTEISRLTDQTNVFLYVESDETINCGWNRDDNITLWVRCVENKTAIIFQTGCHMTSSKYDSYGDVMYRVDDQNARTVGFTASTNNRSLGLWRGGRSIPEIKRLFGGKTLIARMTPFSENSFTATFNITGLEEAIEPLRKSCHW